MNGCACRALQSLGGLIIEPKAALSQPPHELRKPDGRHRIGRLYRLVC